jgi:hypothetical protein
MSPRNFGFAICGLLKKSLLAHLHKEYLAIYILRRNSRKTKCSEVMDP